MTSLSEIIKFKGTWRTYQARVLENADNYLSDGHIHIVAAPGSGKTTLGIELIGRIGNPVLILAPSITIREQWKERIASAFLADGIDPDTIISQNLKSPSLITISTYQALHSAMTKYSGALKTSDNDDEDTDDSQIEEAVDFKGFDLIRTMRSNGALTLCLDECHHLRSEWWKALEEYRSSMGNQTIIALTATPPYDSTASEWQRYINMCGEIDEEITVPELVKEGSLCPHQDFVYFNYPTKDETDIIKAFKARCEEVMQELMENPILLEGIKNHKFITNEASEDEMLEDPSYLSSLLIYLNSKNQKVPSTLVDLLGANKIPAMNTAWMEILLQNLFAHSDDFAVDASFIENLKSDLKRKGVIEKGKIILTTSVKIEKMLLNSIGKLNSILDISTSEYNNLGKDLRLLILTDFIRREYENKLGEDDFSIESLGVLPFFETIRNHFSSYKENAPKLGVLCGSVIIIPSDAKDELISISESIISGASAKLSFAPIGKLDTNNYLKVSTSGSGNFLTGAVTELFSRGFINIIIGTKSLLGEGWDSPCINSLILASFVGSYMLSNQMRGRAIRVMKDNPNKTSNIWHLVCIKPSSVINKEKSDSYGQISISEDWDMLQRRMGHFMGLHYKEDVIEDGTKRLTAIHEPFNKENIELTNKEMLAESMKRDTLKARWEKSLAISKNFEVATEDIIPDEKISAAVFFDAIGSIVISLIIIILINTLSSILKATALTLISNPVSAIVFAITVALILFIIKKVPKLLMLRSPAKRLEKMGNGLIAAMKKKGLLSPGSNYKAEVDVLNDAFHVVTLKGGTQREKELFSKNMCEFFGVVDNQRYILVNPKKKKGAEAYYVVPTVFGDNKENATLFANCVEPFIGKYDLTYTRNEIGRKILLRARRDAYANRQSRITSKRKVKSALE